MPSHCEPSAVEPGSMKEPKHRGTAEARGQSMYMTAAWNTAQKPVTYTGLSPAHFILSFIDEEGKSHLYSRRISQCNQLPVL